MPATKTVLLPALVVSIVGALVFCDTAQSALIAHYPLDASAGGTTPDTTGVNGDGAVNGGPTQSGTGKIGGSFEFTGSASQFVGIADPTFGKTAFTASVWVRPDSLTVNQGPLAQWTNGGPSPRSHLIRSTNTGAINAFVRSGGVQKGGTTSFPTETLSTTQFSIITIAYDGQRLFTYLNGERSPTVADFGAPSTIGEGVAGTSAIGGRGSSERVFDGLIDDVSFFDALLSDGDVRALFTLADDSTLNYDASQADQLFQVHGQQIASANIGGRLWTRATGLTGDDGDLTASGLGFTLVLDAAAGTGVVNNAIPEPSTLLLAAFGLLGLLCGRRRRRS
jgi:hypothetical protein